MFSGTSWNWCINCFECNRGDFFPGLFLKGRLIREGGAELVQATLYCSVLMVVHTSPRLQEVLPKTRNPDQKSLLKTAVTLTSFSAVFWHLQMQLSYSWCSWKDSSETIFLQEPSFQLQIFSYCCHKC